MPIRMLPKDRKADILAAALLVAEREGLSEMTRDDIAKAANCSPGLVSKRLGEMPKLRSVVVQEAVKTERLKVVAQGIALRYKYALNAPDDLKQRALATLGK